MQSCKHKAANLQIQSCTAKLKFSCQAATSETAMVQRFNNTPKAQGRLRTQRCKPANTKLHFKQGYSIDRSSYRKHGVTRCTRLHASPRFASPASCPASPSLRPALPRQGASPGLRPASCILRPACPASGRAPCWPTAVVPASESVSVTSIVF